jgi:hypothetical protein
MIVHDTIALWDVRLTCCCNLSFLWSHAAALSTPDAVLVDGGWWSSGVGQERAFLETGMFQLGSEMASRFLSMVSVNNHPASSPRERSCRLRRSAIMDWCNQKS